MIAKLNFKEILVRKRTFVSSGKIFEYEDYERNGELDALNEMIADCNILSEDEFVDKYLGIIDDLDNKFEQQFFKDEEDVAKMSYYNNMIVWALRMINPIYEYDKEYHDL